MNRTAWGHCPPRNPLVSEWRFTAAFLAIQIGVFVYAIGGSALLMIDRLSPGKVTGDLFVLPEEDGQLQVALEELWMED